MYETPHRTHSKVYVVSEDVPTLLAPILRARELVLPGSEFFADLRKEMQAELERIFPDLRVVFISEDEMRTGINRLVEETGSNPIVNMDKVYFEGGIPLEVTRLVDAEGEKLGLGSRITRSVDDQIGDIEKAVQDQQVRLVDDVIFNGDTIIEVVKRLNERGVVVSHIVAGIMMSQDDTPGRIVSECTATNGGIEIEVKAAYVWSDFVDEICERDFYAGAPLSGKLIGDSSLLPVFPETGRPYFWPFGDPNGGASVRDLSDPNDPDGVSDVSKRLQREWSIFCLKQSIKLWTTIELLSNRDVLASELTRLPQDIACDETRFVDSLRRHLASL